MTDYIKEVSNVFDCNCKGFEIQTLSNKIKNLKEVRYHSLRSITKHILNITTIIRESEFVYIRVCGDVRSRNKKIVKYEVIFRQNEAFYVFCRKEGKLALELGSLDDYLRKIVNKIHKASLIDDRIVPTLYKMNIHYK